MSRAAAVEAAPPAQSKPQRGPAGIWPGLADYGVSSLTNFALSVLVAASVPAREFGAFSLAFATYLLAAGAGRALAGEPLMLRFSGCSKSQWRAASSGAMGCCIAVGLVFAAGCWTAAAAGLYTGPFIALGLVMPGLVLQDGFRYSFFSAGLSGHALANDFVWAAIELPAIVLLVSGNRASVAALILVWGGSGTVAAAVAALQARVWPAVLSTGRWLSTQRDLAPRFLGEFAAAGGANASALYLTAGIAGVVEAAFLRGA
ncbi:MAG: hypothetical protein ACRDIU_08950, partial [Actinomycetota bacterium]